MEKSDPENSLVWSASILAGGVGKRMGGRNKGFLKINSKTFMDYLLETLEKGFQNIYISSNQVSAFSAYNYPIIPDTRKNVGPLGGIESILKASSSQYVFFIACDMPLLQGKLIQQFKEYLSFSWDVIVPVDQKNRLIPTCAVYHKNCLPKIQENLNKGIFKVQDVLKQMNLKVLPPKIWQKSDPEGLSFQNINTLHEYQDLQEKWGDRKNG